MAFRKDLVIWLYCSVVGDARPGTDREWCQSGHGGGWHRAMPSEAVGSGLLGDGEGTGSETGGEDRPALSVPTWRCPLLEHSGSPAKRPPQGPPHARASTYPRDLPRVGQPARPTGPLQCRGRGALGQGIWGSEEGRAGWEKVECRQSPGVMRPAGGNWRGRHRGGGSGECQPLCVCPACRG